MLKIQKVVKVENLGRFEKLDSPGSATFGDMTLIFGQNGKGKTTLAGLFRSLATGDPAYVAERERVGADAKATAQILCSGGLASFRDGGWSRTEPEIEIFDTTFVTDNVYTGDRVEQGHRKNLYEVVVGPDAVELAKKQDGIDAEQRQAAKEIKNIEGKLRDHVQAPFSIEVFEGLVAEEGVEERIQSKTTQLNSVRKSKEVLSRRGVEQFAVPETPAQVLALLSVGVDELSEKARLMVQKHMAESLGHGGEAWLRKGLEYLGGGGSCPFCSQEVDGSALVQAFTDYFSDVYREHVVELERGINTVEKRLSEDALRRVERLALQNDGVIKGWADLADISYASASTEELAASWRDLRARLVELLRQKLAAPSKPMAAEAKLEAAVRDFDDARERLLRQNLKVEEANEEIGRLKQASASGDEREIEGELRRLRNIQIRQEPEVEELCQKLSSAREKRGDAEKEKAALKERLKSLAEEVLGEYESSINRHLEAFGATFRISGTRPSWAGGKSSSIYKIELNAQTVELGDGRTPKGTPCFRTALSSGDKSTLALAFFLAKMERDEKLNEKVVVLDDPFSSLDEFRKARTRHLICQLSEKASQVIVFSHDPFFLKGVFDAVERSKVKSLHVVRSGGACCKLEPWDVSRACLSTPMAAHFTLQTYLDEGIAGGADLRAVAQDIRIFLEGTLRGLYPLDFGTGMMLGGFISLIRDADDGSRLASLRSRLQELEDINEFARRFHHAEDGAHGEPNDDELQSFVKRALAVVRPL